MNVLGIYGSPRKKGNTDLVLDWALDGIEKADVRVKQIHLRDFTFSGCIECGGCEKTGMCVLTDDMQDFYPLLDEADVIILASPIFFYGLTSQVKAFIDRGQACWCRKKLRYKGKDEKDNFRGKGYLIALGATKGENLFEGVQLVARYFFDALEMNYEGGLFFQKIESKGAVKNHPEILKKAFEFGQGIVGSEKKI